MKKLVIIAGIVFATTLPAGCCKKSTIGDVGTEIAEASDIAKMQFQRCRAEDNESACEDVKSKLDSIEQLAIKLAEKAEEAEKVEE